MARSAPVAGVLPAAIGSGRARPRPDLSGRCGGEAAWAGDLEIIAAPSLLALINH